MSLIFAQDTIEPQNWSLAAQITHQQLMFGQLDVSLPSFYLDSLYSPEKVELISLLKSLKYWVLQQENKFKRWTQIILNSNSLKSKRILGIKCFQPELLLTQLIYFQKFLYMTQSLDSCQWRLSVILSLTSWETKTQSYQMEMLFLICLTLLKKKNQPPPQKL